MAQGTIGDMFTAGTCRIGVCFSLTLFSLVVVVCQEWPTSIFSEQFQYIIKRKSSENL